MVNKVPRSALQCLIQNGFNNPAVRGCHSICEYYTICKALYDKAFAEMFEPGDVIVVTRD